MNQISKSYLIHSTNIRIEIEHEQRENEHREKQTPKKEHRKKIFSYLPNAPQICSDYNPSKTCTLKFAKQMIELLVKPYCIPESILKNFKNYPEQEMRTRVNKLVLSRKKISNQMASPSLGVLTDGSDTEIEIFEQVKVNLELERLETRMVSNFGMGFGWNWEGIWKI